MGKSSLLKRLFSFLSQKSCEGLGTNCPIELKCGVSYKKNNMYFVDINNKRYEGDNINNSIEIAEKCVNEHFGTSHIEGKIVIEMIDDTHNFTITDLPGCINNNDDYFNKMKDRYLNRLGNIIIYVARGVDDPETDMSLNFLKETKNDKICVLTHTDYWEHDPEKEKNLDKYTEMFDIVFLVNNKGDTELDYLQKYQNNDKIILGTHNLLSYLGMRLNNKLSEMLPTLSNRINTLHNDTNNKLNEDDIGTVPLDKKNICSNYVSYLLPLINNDLNFFGPKYIITFCNIILPNIKKCFANVPQAHILSGEINDNDQITGWGTLFKKYIDNMTKSAIMWLSNTIDSYFNNLLERLLNVKYDYRSRTKKQEKLIKSHIEVLIANAKENAKTTLCGLINKITTNREDIIEYMDSYRKEIIGFQILEYSKSITKFYKSRLLVKLIDSESSEQISNDIIKESSCSSISSYAKEQYILLKHIWNNKCKHMVKGFSDSINVHENVLKENIIKMINDIRYDDIDEEPAEITIFRKNLHEIERECRRLKENINCYSSFSTGLNEISKNYS